MTIREGHHYSRSVPRILWAPESVTRVVTFTPSCTYNIGPEQEDVNKLFGIGYLPYHRRNSVRFGWRWMPSVGKIMVLLYAYVDGLRDIRFMTFVEIGERHTYTIRRSGDVHVLSVADAVASVRVPISCIAYQLNPYFGGTLPAPHDVEIDMQ